VPLRVAPGGWIPASRSAGIGALLPKPERGRFGETGQNRSSRVAPKICAIRHKLGRSTRSERASSTLGTRRVEDHLKFCTIFHAQHAQRTTRRPD